MEEWSKVMEAGATPPVDIFPFLKLIPESLFNNWRTRCRNVGRAMDTLYGRMVSRVQTRRLKSGTSESFMDVVLDQQDKLQLSRNELNFLCGVLMEGGSDTASSIILAFIHAMIKYPEVQKKAQQDIDAVVGEDRSPLWSDFSTLPYINMIVKETMRWRPVTPLAFPHATSEGISHLPFPPLSRHLSPKNKLIHDHPKRTPSTASISPPTAPSSSTPTAYTTTHSRPPHPRSSTPCATPRSRCALPPTSPTRPPTPSATTTATAPGGGCVPGSTSRSVICGSR